MSQPPPQVPDDQSAESPNIIRISDINDIMQDAHRHLQNILRQHNQQNGMTNFLNIMRRRPPPTIMQQIEEGKFRIISGAPHPHPPPPPPQTATTENPAVDIPPGLATATRYDPENHFRSWINQFQAESQPEIKNQEIRDIEEELRTNNQSPTVNNVRRILQQRRSTAENVNHRRILYGLGLDNVPELSPQVNSNLIEQFNILQSIFERVRQPQRYNFDFPTYIYDETKEDASKDDKSKQCCICLQIYQNGDEITTLPCIDRFHTSCIKPWIERNPSCPLCKFSLLSR